MKERIAILKSEIEHDIQRLNRLFKKFEKSYNDFSATSEYSKLVESAFYVNQLYTGFESIFKNVAKTFENNIEDDYWHKSLLERMTLSIEDIRPALISEELFNCLNELRAFRHFFRHAYDTDIERDKFKIVADRVYKIRNSFQKGLKKFLLFLDSLIA
jgi:hypothetical protein